MLLLLAGDVWPAAAQVVQAPPGSQRGIFGSGSAAPAAPDLTLTIDLDGGHDDNRVADSNLPIDQFGPIQTGYVSTAAAVLRYQKGSGDRYILGGGSGSINQQQIGNDLRSFRLYRGEGSYDAPIATVTPERRPRR